MKLILNRVLQNKSLSRAEAREIMKQLASNQVPPEQAGALLAALRMKSETIDEITGFVEELRSQSVKVDYPVEGLMDVCGTGGDNSGTFNVSTCVAFCVAACGQKVAKHGNRSVSSRSGSFDVLETLGIPSQDDQGEIARSFDKFNLAFLFAPKFHPALKNLAAVRKNLGVFTVFNLLGPLLNPANVRRQVMGVYDGTLLEKIPYVLRELGSTNVMVVHGDDGLDEISIAAPTQAAFLKNGEISRITITPEDCGVRRSPLSSVKGGSPEENAKIILDVLGGQKGPARDMVVLNAAAALLVGEKAADLKEGAALAARSIDSGGALEILEAMKQGLRR